MSALDELLVRHRVDLSEAAHALRLVLEPAVPLTAAELDELADSGFDVNARVDPEQALVDEARRQVQVAEAYTGPQVAANNEISPGRVRSKAAVGELVVLLVDGVQRFPRFQFDDRGRIRSGLDKVSPHVPDDWSWVGYSNFLTTAGLELDGRLVTPLEWLAAGKPAADVIANMGNTW